MHVIFHTHAIPPVWHTHRAEDKKQVWLELNIYFDNLMCMVTSIHLEINTDTMHQYVVGWTTLKTMMCMLLDELDRGARSVYPDAMEARVFFQQVSPLSARKPSWMTNLGISSPPSIIARMSKIWSYHNLPSLGDVLHGFLKPFCLTSIHVQIVCNIL